MTTPTAPFTFDETTVVLANPAQRRRTREHTFPEWGAGKGFHLESYCRRDEVMAEETGGYDTWVLVPRKSLDTVDEILASCETYRRRSIVRQPIRTSPSPKELDDHTKTDNEPIEVSNIAIACVYVNPVYAGYHYARHHLQLMHYILAPKEDLPEFPTGVWGEAPKIPKGWKGDAAFSVLYSGIGAEYYTKARQGHGPDSRPGWAVVPSSRGRVWKIDSSTNIDQVDSHNGSSREDDSEASHNGSSREDDSEAEDEGRWLTADDVRAIESLADKEVRRQVDEVEVGKDVVMAVLPSGDTLYQHCLRDQLSPTGMTLGRPRTYGYLEPRSLDSSTTLPANNDNNITDSDLPFFTYRFRTGLKDPQRLCITFVRHPVPWTSVLRAALKEGCGSVEIWGEAGDVWVKEGAGKPEVDDPTVCLVSYRWSGLGLRWVMNERYGWC